MKKYIMFFISIGLLLGIVLFYNVLSIEKSKEVTFSESGYILNNSSERFYFYQDEKYTKSYDDKIVFFDTEGSKVTVGHDNFVHYESGNILALQESVLLDLSKIDDDPIVYYNIAANKEIKKLSNRYTIKNLDTELQLQKVIWKIAQNKYIILGDKITIKLNNGIEKEVEGYIEIEYSDNEVVNIYNQEISYQTISSDSYIELSDDIKLNLGSKIVSKKDENKMSLEDMVINSDDNVTLVDLNNETDKEETNETEENSTENQVVEGTLTNISNNSSTNNSNSQSSVIVQGGNSGNQSGKPGSAGDLEETEKDENVIEIVTPDIKYENSEEGETGVDITKVTVEPKFKLEKMEVTSVGITGKIKITDEDDLLNKDEQLLIKIINNNTGKTIYSENYDYGRLTIDLDIQTLTPNTSYTIIATGTYTVNDTSYTRNFLYKTFVTPNIGINIGKNGFTDTSLGFKLEYKDNLISQVECALLNSEGEKVRYQTVKNSNNGEEEEVIFTELNPNTKYKLMISKIIYNDYTQEGENWKLYYDDCQTLKRRAEIKENYSIDTRNAKFKLFVENVVDKDEAIINYTYVMYKGEMKIENGKEVIVPNNKPVYTKETQSKEINVDIVNNEADGEIVRNEYYYFKVIANCFDNEKYVEVGSDLKGPFILDGKSFPIVKFEEREDGVTATAIKGNLQLHDTDGSIVLDKDNPLTIIYTDSIEGEKEYGIYKDMTAITLDEENNIYNVPIVLQELRANTSYTFYVYGTINLENGNEPYKNVLIGSTIISTKRYETLKGNFEADTRAEIGFDISLNLSQENVYKNSLENLSSITFALQSGANFDDKQEYKTVTITNDTAIAYAREGTNVKDLKDLLKDNNLTIIPSDFGGNISDYIQTHYTILATMTIDNTKYKNKIPIEAGSNNNTKTVSFNKNKEEYTAIGITIKMENPSISNNTWITASAITNKDAEKYTENGISKDLNLKDSTVVGYKLNPTINKDDTIFITSITYYVWDNNRNPVMDEHKNQLTISVKPSEGNNYLNSNQYSAVVPVHRGTSDSLEQDLKSGKLIRGCTYYFSMMFEYRDSKDPEGGVNGVKTWPNSENSNEKTCITYSSYSPEKQMPEIIMYPLTSNENSITYKYINKDYDYALIQADYPLDQDNKYTKIAYYNENNAIKGNEFMRIYADNSGTGEFTAGSETNKLAENAMYEVRCSYKLNKNYKDNKELKCTKQKFEGIVELPNTIRYVPTYDVTKNPNRIIIDLKYTGSQYDNDQFYNENYNKYFSRIAGAQVIIDDTPINKIYPIKAKGSDKRPEYYIDVNLLELSNVTELIGKTVEVGLNLYFDNGVSGYEYTGGEYFAYGVLNQSTSETVTTSYNYNYYNFNNKNIENLNPQNIFEGNMLDTNDNVFMIKIKGINYYLDSTRNGLKYGDNILIPKKIALHGIGIASGNTSKVNINNVKVGIKLDSIQENLQSVEFTAKLVMTEGLAERIKDNKMIVQVCEIANREAEANWNDANKVKSKDIDLKNYTDIYNNDGKLKINNNETELFKFEITGLEPAKYYKVRYTYKDESLGDVVMYNPDFIGNDFESTVSTVATIGIDNENINIEQKFNSYTDKKLVITYNINEYVSDLYAKTRYDFYEYNKETNKKEKDPTISYTIDNDNKLKTNVSHSLDISPQNNKITFGKTYIIDIVPIVKNETRDIEIEKVEYIWETTKLKEPTLNFKFIRNENGKVEISTAFKDDDKVIVNGTYTVKVLEGDIEQPIKEESINDSTINKSLIIENAESSKKYKAEVIFEVDMQNNGRRTRKNISKTLEAMEDENAINLGEVYKELSENKFKITFVNSYKLQENVNSIDYQINIKNVGETVGTIGRTIDNNNNIISKESITWYQEEKEVWIILPKEIENTENIQYNIQLKFYNINDEGVKTLLAEI